jgi:hypothetical protein
LIKSIVHLLILLLITNQLGALLHSAVHEHQYCFEHRQIEEMVHHSDDHGNQEMVESNVKKPLTRLDDSGEREHRACSIECLISSSTLLSPLNFEVAENFESPVLFVGRFFFQQDFLSFAPKASPPALT